MLTRSTLRRATSLPTSVMRSQDYLRVLSCQDGGVISPREGTWRWMGGFEVVGSGSEAGGENMVGMWWRFIVMAVVASIVIAAIVVTRLPGTSYYCSGPPTTRL